MYSSIQELPTQVRNAFDEEDQEKFLKAYNSYKGEYEEAMRKAWHSCKDLPSSFSFEIIASADAMDSQREVIELDSVKDQMDSFIKAGGPVMHEHGNYQIATIYDWAPVKLDGGMDAIKVYGNMYGNNDVCKEARKNFLKGVNSLSIAGEAPMGKYICDDHGCALHRRVKTLMEISLCKVPVNKHCKMITYHEGIAKSESAEDKDNIHFGIRDVQVHKSYNECPTLAIKKSMCDAGFDAHATPVGVMVKMSKEDFKKSLPHAERHEMSAIWVDGTAVFNDKRTLAENTYKSYLAKGYIEPNGRIHGDIPKQRFTDLVEKGIVCRDGIGYRIYF